MKAQEICDMLNEIVKTDRESISSLIQNRVKCSNELAEKDIPLVIGLAPNGGKDYEFGVLGLINGIIDCGVIAANYDENMNLLNFQLINK